MLLTFRWLFIVTSDFLNGTNDFYQVSSPGQVNPETLREV